MAYYLIFGFISISFLAYKIYDCVLRNRLSKFEKIKLGVSITLVVLFIITSKTLPYPESLYWFILLSILLIAGLLSSKVIRVELKRQLALSKKDMVVNMLFYSLLVSTLMHVF